MEKRKALITRCGALGDNIMVTPIFKKLKEMGYKVIVHTGKRGMGIFEGNPNIDEKILYPNEDMHNPNIQEDWDKVKEEVKPDWYKNFSESIEVNVALHPRSPSYIYPKFEREERGGRNYYDATVSWAGLDIDKPKPELFVTKEEEVEASKYLKKNKVNILWCLSGSGKNKVYPYTDYVMGEVLKEYSNVHFITVGSELCQLIETLEDNNITNLAGKISFRISVALTKLCDLVLSPDTGVLHASGSFSTPKIGILGHTTQENITKYFENDYSLNADEVLCECSPCYRLIYDHHIQCPIDNLTGAAYCMSHGQPPDRLYKRISEVLDVIKNGKSTKEGSIKD